MAGFDTRSIWSHGWDDLNRIPTWARVGAGVVMDGFAAAAGFFLLPASGASTWVRAGFAFAGVIVGAAAFGMAAMTAWLVWALIRGPLLQRDSARRERDRLASDLAALAGETAPLVIERLEPRDTGFGWRLRAQVTNEGEPAEFHVRIERPVTNVFDIGNDARQDDCGDFPSMWEYPDAPTRHLITGDQGTLRLVLAFVEKDGVFRFFGGPGVLRTWKPIRALDPAKPITAIVRITDHRHHRVTRFLISFGIRGGDARPFFDIADPPA